MIPRLRSAQNGGLDDDSTIRAESGAWFELAVAEAVLYPDLAAGDARRAFESARPLPGSLSDLSGATPPSPRAALGWMHKVVIEPGAIQLLVSLKQDTLARELARTGTVDRADLYDAIVRTAPIDDVLSLADECRSLDGTYPYLALADRARSAPESVKPLILQRPYAMVASETEFKSQSLALSFLLRTWDLMPAAAVARTLDNFLRQLITHPSGGPGGTSARDAFGPQVLELMAEVDSNRATALAGEYPDLEAARHIPGKTTGNPVNGPRGIGRPVQQPPLTMPRPRRTLPAMAACGI